MATQVQIAKWGNSLGLRVPRDLAARLGLTEGTRVDVEARGDLEKMLGTKVYLDLAVRVRKDWRSDGAQIKRFGYGEGL